MHARVRCTGERHPDLNKVPDYVSNPEEQVLPG